LPIKLSHELNGPLIRSFIVHPAEVELPNKFQFEGPLNSSSIAHQAELPGFWKKIWVIAL
jgi:hypothetical protein